MSEQYLKDAIVSYINNNLDRKLDAIDIVSYFKLRADITYMAIDELKNEGRIHRHNGALSGWNGNHYYTT